MTISAWLSLLLAFPVLVLGEWLVAKVNWLSKYHIPAPVVGGLTISLLVYAFAQGGIPIELASNVQAPWWNWVVLPEPRWFTNPSLDVYRPFLVGFFACIGLNAPWRLLQKAGWQLPLFLVLAASVTILQNALGAGIAVTLGQSPLLGLICGSIAMTGGHGTALGFADVLSRAGFQGAAVVGTAAATFGLVSGGLIGGPLAGFLVRRFNLRSSEHVAHHEHEHGDEEDSSFLGLFRALYHRGRPALGHLLLLLATIKVGAWCSYFLEKTGLTIPVYIGSMVVGIFIRNLLESAGKHVISSDTINQLGSICLGVFLTVAMMTLKLQELAGAALPMMLILFAQVAFILAFTRYITFNSMGRDYDAAIMAAGHCGFGLGATPTAIANMKALVDRFGPAPRAFLVVPLVGAFFIDFINTLVITIYLNVFTR